MISSKTTDPTKENQFELYYGRFVFHLESLANATLPPYLGSALRGVLGRAFRKIACLRRRESCEGCMFITRCAYAYVFETSSFTVPEETGHHYIPHPFLLEPPLNGDIHFAPGDRLSFTLLLLGQGLAYLPYFITAFQMLEKLGLSAARYPFTLVKVEQIWERNSLPIWNGGGRLIATACF